MELRHITTSKFIFNPKKPEFEQQMIDRSNVFDLKWRRKDWLTYITIVYDLNSELRRNTREYIQRKVDGAKIAGFEMKNGSFDKRVENILLGENEEFNRAVVEYVYYNFNNDYKLLYILEESYNKAIRDQGSKLQVLGDKDRKNLTETKIQIEGLEQVLFGGVETINMKKALYEGTEAARTRLRREDEMKMFEENGLDPWNPFPGYKVEKLECVGDKIPR
ncbi:hypothetical protein JW865_09340 [Candidatus Bathyarchaeota archaeon]|nr:hypothetical protein [Candidatus Bathyarchaeota archaeon]